MVASSRHRRFRRRVPFVPGVLVGVALSLVALAAIPDQVVSARPVAAQATNPTSAEESPPVDRAAVGVPEPGVPAPVEELPDDWYRSTDVAYDAHPTLGGYEIMVAREAERWTWKPLATIKPAGLGDVTLTGYHCVTGDGAWVVAVIAPVEFMNTPWLRDRGGWAYRISTETGEVAPLRAGVAVKYHTPGCGAGADAALVSHLGVDQERSRVEVVDVASGTSTAKVTVDGQVTSAVPDGDRIVAARDKGVVALDRSGAERTIAETPGSPFQLRATTGGVSFLVANDEEARSGIWVAAADQAAEVGSGPLVSTNLVAGASGRVFAVGPEITLASKDSPVSVVGASASTAGRVEATSRLGRLAIVDPTPEQTGATVLEPSVSGVPNRLAVRPDTDVTVGIVAAAEGSVPATSAASEVALPVIDPADAAEAGPPPPVKEETTGAVSETQSADAEAAPPAQLPESNVQEASAKPSSALANDGTAVPAVYLPGSRASLTPAQWTTPKCAVPRNALNRQVPQPNAAQVDWAIQQATRNLLKNSVLTRPSNFANLGLSSYQPSNDFSRATLSGSASSVPVPPSVIQGTYAQESNWKQASQRALPGVSGNPLVGDYYGSGGTLNVIAYENADCGYGVSQVTDPMTAASTAYSANGKTKVAVDYAENVAAGIQFLVDKWNLLKSNTLSFNGGDPQYLENWWGALWAYNSGWNSPDSTGAKGLGWTNNPMNADYPANRTGFLRLTYGDAAHPGDWSYPERVAGWMEQPQLDYKGNPQYDIPTYPSGSLAQEIMLPTRQFFCTSHNSCDTTHMNGSLSYCTRSDRHCWWSLSDSWTTCPDYCSQSQFTVSTTATEPAATDNYPPNCNDVPTTADPPRAVIIVDDQPSNLNVEGCTTSGWSNGGTFAVTYGTDTSGAPLGQIDWHQLGTGFGGHTWFTKNRVSTDTPRVNSATWTPSGLSSGLYTVKVHVPPSGASTPTAHYKVWTSATSYVDRYVDQHLHENRWVTIGSFNLSSGAKVELSNVTGETANYTTNVAFDAIAFVPARGTPQSVTTEAVAVLDHNQNLDTNGTMLIDSPLTTEASTLAWADSLINGDGSHDGVLDYAACSGSVTNTCVGSATRSAVTGWVSQINTQPIAQWMGYSNPDPALDPTSAYLEDATHFKQRNKLTLDYLVDGGQIVPGSMVVTATHVTGTSHMADFVRSFMASVATDYGVPAPDLSTSLVNVGTYSHATSTFDPAPAGSIPARAYRPYVTQPTYNGTCAQVSSIDGGADGWKAYLNEGGVTAAVEAWVGLLRDKVSAGEAPEAVHRMASEIYGTLFSNTYEILGTPPSYIGSIFRFAPPIWVEQHINVCANGSVTPSGSTVASVSYMPDLYFYVNGHATTATGVAQSGSGSGPAAPIAVGDFATFGNPRQPFQLGDDHPWGQCGISGRPERSGNAWNIDQFDSEPTGSSVSLCSVHQVHDHGDG